MALGFVLVGIATGFLIAGFVLAFGGGVWLAALAYAGGGLAGLIGSLAGSLLPGSLNGRMASSDHS